MDTRREVVSFWRKRFFDQRLAGFDDRDRSGRPRVFPPEVIMEVKALACELPATTGTPLSRWSVADIARQVRSAGFVATISDKTVWRWLNEDAIHPWQHRCWLFPRDPQFILKASRILDLYERVWDGKRLKKDEFVLSADEETSIKARQPRHQTLPTNPGVSHEGGTRKQALWRWVYIAAMDVHCAKFFGRCERKSGIATFDRLVGQVMTAPPYNEARRVFWIVDNGSSHRGPKSVLRLKSKYPILNKIAGIRPLGIAEN